MGGPRGRYVHRVSGEDVGQRVSVRHLVAQPRDGGATTTDVVGRLLACDEEALLLVDRAGDLHVIATERVRASRVVPPHPRLEPEPQLGTRDAPLPRAAARMLLLDIDDRVLLVSQLPGDGSRVWTAPGGGLRPGEDHRLAAEREVTEELGVHVAAGPLVWIRRATFAFRGVWIEQSERWFLAATRQHIDPATAPLRDVGSERAHWWSRDELAATDETFAPEALATHLARLLRDGPPAEPVDVGR